MSPAAQFPRGANTASKWVRGVKTAFESGVGDAFLTPHAGNGWLASAGPIVHPDAGGVSSASEGRCGVKTASESGVGDAFLTPHAGHGCLPTPRTEMRLA